jgi:metal-responsive CopG/Arc/MetJ family transcriptional regulator
MKTIQMTIDEELLAVVDQFTRSLNTTRSAFIRRALEAQIKRQRLQEDEARHAQGYLEKPVVPGEFDAWQHEQDWGAR